MNKDVIVSVDYIGDECLGFSNGWRLSSYHSQDCCEEHYLSFDDIELRDFEGLQFEVGEDGKFFDYIEGYGIELKPAKGWSVKIPGYGSNNGYYSDRLDLILKDDKGNVIAEWDITECQDVSG